MESRELGAEAVAKLIDKTRRTFNIALFASLLTRLLTGWLYAASAILIVLKVVGASEFTNEYHVLPILAGSGIIVIAVVSFLTHQKKYDRLDTAAWLDLNSRGGGEIIGNATGKGPTSATALPVESRLRLGKIALSMALPLIFTVAALLVPWRQREDTFTASLDERAELVEERVQKARVLGVVPEKTMLSLKQDLNRAKKRALTHPESAAEAVDSVAERLDKEIRKSIRLSKNAVVNANNLLAEASRPSEESLSGAADEMKKTLKELFEREQLTNEILKELKKMQKKAGGDGASQEGANGQMGQNAKSLESLDTETLRQLARAMRNGQMAQLDELRKAGLLGEGQCQSIAAFLDGQKNGRNGPGKGGRGRGPGEAPLRLGWETPELAAKFKQVPLKPSKQLLPGQMVRSRRSAGGTPPPPEFRPPARTGAIVSPDEGVVAAENLGPHSRAVAEKYFSELSEEK